MAHLVPGLLICLVAATAVQYDGNRTSSKTKKSTGLEPKSFKGMMRKPNHTSQLPIRLYPSTNPWLYVNSEDAVTAYTKGGLSTLFIPSSYILAMLVGIPSNTYILAFLRNKAKSCSSVVLYMNLALFDLLLLLSLALRVHYHFNGNNWTFGEISCRLITALFYGNVYCSAQTIACISLKRYLAVVRPFLYRRLVKTMLAFWTCLVVWFLFAAAAVPELLVRQSFLVSPLGVTTCHDVLPLEEKSRSILVPYRLLLVCLGSIVPFLICIYSHVAVVYHLGQSGCDWRPFIRISTVVFIIFMACFLPSGILQIAHYSRLLFHGDDTLYGYYKVAVCLCCLHSCIDPFLCILISQTTTSELRFISLHRSPQRPAVM